MNMTPEKWCREHGGIEEYDNWNPNYPWDEMKINSQISVRIRGGYVTFTDNKSESFQITGGERRTIGSQYSELPNVFILGPCIAYGQCVRDEDTIASFFQKELDGVYNVHNMMSSYYSIGNRMRSLQTREGDIVILFISAAEEEEDFRNKGVPVLSLRNSFLFSSEENPGDYFWDSVYHCNDKMNKRIARELKGELLAKEQIRENLPNVKEKEYRTLWLKDKTLHLENIYMNHDESIREWFNVYRSYARSGNNGAIVMNANPFTKGHRYLVEQSSKQVDYLYIFAVEENLSDYDFSYRYRMISEGTKDINNVIVIPSGKFIISQFTLPGYFEKDNLQESVYYDAMGDLELFSEVVAPVFSIKVRFVGDEPEDYYTNRYNEQMSIVLPQYDIAFHVLERMKSGEKVISGKRVRGLHKEKKWDELAEFVPDTTLEILKQMG